MGLSGAAWKATGESEGDDGLSQRVSGVGLNLLPLVLAGRTEAVEAAAEQCWRPVCLAEESSQRVLRWWQRRSTVQAEAVAVRCGTA